MTVPESCPSPDPVAALPAALISMPWAIFNRPSIQLGALKAYIEQTSNLQITCFHVYLVIAQKLGITLYNSISSSGWAGESLFSALLFPELQEQSEHLFKDSIGRKPNDINSFPNLCIQIRESLDSWLRSTPWHQFCCIGFSLCFNQLLASLYLAAKMKQDPRCPPIVFGGSSCTGALGRTLSENFPQVDYVIDGEGEIPFAGLCRHLNDKKAPFPERIFCRHNHKKATPCPEIKDLNCLPVPDYRPYFRQVEVLFPDMPFIPDIPVEFSRGCWWNKCAFCNLNLQWNRYRWKDSARIHEEITTLKNRHKCLDFIFSDNSLPPKESGAFVRLLENDSADYHFFAEIRATTTPQEMKLYRKAGILSIQVGIEAISETLLRKLNKGTSVIENIAVMKYAADNSITLDGNLIIEFPGTTEKEVEETLQNLEYLLPFKPLKTAVFFLGYGSPVFNEPRKYSIQAVFPHRKNRSLFPEPLLSRLALMTCSYRGDRIAQKKRWQAVKEKVARWHQFHHSRTTSTTSPLSYRDGTTFIVIRQERPGTQVLRHRLSGDSRAIYLYCSVIRSLEEIHQHFDHLQANAVDNFITRLCSKYLMFRQGDMVIALASPEQMDS